MRPGGESRALGSDTVQGVRSIQGTPGPGFEPATMVLRPGSKDGEVAVQCSRAWQDGSEDVAEPEPEDRTVVDPIAESPMMTAASGSTARRQ